MYVYPTVTPRLPPRVPAVCIFAEIAPYRVSKKLASSCARPAAALRDQLLVGVVAIRASSPHLEVRQGDVVLEETRANEPYEILALQRVRERRDLHTV